MKILLTGGSGFVGKKLSSFLRSKGHRVFSLSRTEGNHDDDYACDLTDSSQINKILEIFHGYEFDVFINLSSKLMTDNNKEILSENINIASGIIFLAIKLSPKKIINASSTAVYPNLSGFYDEDAKVMPSINSDAIYGLSKFITENLIDINLLKQGVNCIHLRICQIHGDGMNPQRIIPTLRDELVESKKMTLWGNGERVIPLIEINNLVKIVEKFASNKCSSGVYNVAEEHMSIKDIAIKIAKDINIDDYQIIYREEGNKSKFKISTEKLKYFLEEYK